MRISDWSSDVCSSDLRHHRLLAGPEVLPAVDDDIEKLGIAERVQRILESRRIGAAERIGAMAGMASGVVAAEAVVGSIVDLAVPDDVRLLLPVHLTGVVALGVVAGMGIVAALAGSSPGPPDRTRGVGGR